MKNQIKSIKTDTLHRSLNDFPDGILCHILSFLPTKLAVRTSVLSERWRFMWTSLPSLDFVESCTSLLDVFGRTTPSDVSEDSKIERNNYKDFVDRVLDHHNAPRIKKFTLSCNVEDDVSRVKNWIAAAVRRNPQELHISLYRIDEESEDNQDVFPVCLYRCEAMETLKIKADYAHFLPSQICLPNLKTLTLNGVTFRDYHQLNLFFSSSPIEDLVIDNCIWENSDPLTISVPKLQRLIIDEDDDEYETDEAALIAVTIFAPVLRNFCYTGPFTNDYLLSFSSTMDMSMICFPDDCGLTENIQRDHFLKVITSLRFVEHLSLSSFAFAEGISHDAMPIFENLIGLDICQDYIDISCKGLETFLKKCPRLESLEFPMGISENSSIDSLLRAEFTCLSSLKKIMIVLTTGSIKELLVVQVLLEKAVSLETMVIELDFGASATELETIENYLSAVPRKSKSCDVYLR